MSDVTLNELFGYIVQTPLRQVYLPIDAEAIPNFDKNWLLKLVTGSETDKEKLDLLKAHEYVRKGNLIQASLDKLDLQILFYADEKNTPLTRMRELVFTHRYSPSGQSQSIRLNEMGDWDIADIRNLLTNGPNWATGYDSDEINPSLAEITNIGKQFDVNFFGKTNRDFGVYNKMGASKFFEYEGGKAKLTYNYQIDNDGIISNFGIRFEIFTRDDKPSDFSADINVKKKQNGEYAATAEIRVKSDTAERLGAYDGLVTYKFGEDGTFESIEIHGTNKMVFDKKDMENRRLLLSQLEGVVFYDNQYCLKLTTDPKNSQIYALLNNGGTHHAIQSIENGKLELGKDYNLVPVVQLGALPGLQYDMYMVQNYLTLAREFANINLFKEAASKGVENMGMDYVSAIIAMANIQNIQAHDIPLLM